MFNDHVMTQVDYPTLRRLLIHPKHRLPGVDYDRLAQRIQQQDFNRFDWFWARISPGSTPFWAHGRNGWTRHSSRRKLRPMHPFYGYHVRSSETLRFLRSGGGAELLEIVEAASPAQARVRTACRMGITWDRV